MTFTCYGSHLPGGPRGSFDHMRSGGRRLLSARLKAYCHREMKEEAYLLSSPTARSMVRDAIVEVCRYRSWFLYALRVRTNHVHGVVEADCAAGRILNAWKAYATRRLKALEMRPDRTYWTRGGSARHSLTAQGLTCAMDYVLRGQGEPMEVYCASPRADARG